MSILNKYKKLALAGMVLGSAGLMQACTGDFEEMNTSKTKLTTLSDDELPFLFSRAQQQASYQSGTYQIAQNLFADLVRSILCYIGNIFSFGPLCNAF